MVTGTINVCVNDIPLTQNAGDLQFVSVFPSGGANDRSDETKLVSRDPDVRCQAELEVSSWTGALVPTLGLEYFGPDQLDAIADVTVEVTALG